MFYKNKIKIMKYENYETRCCLLLKRPIEQCGTSVLIYLTLIRIIVKISNLFKK